MHLISRANRPAKSPLLTIALFLGVTSGAICADYYAAPTGTSAGKGSLAKPWDLVTALNASTTIKPGDTLWLRGGTYKMRYPADWMPTIAGTPTQPIIVRRYPNEWVVLDEGNLSSAFYVMPTSHDVWYWGLEITATGIARSTSGSGPWSELDATIEIHGQGTKFINCYVHDLSQAFSFWQDATNSELYGNVVLDNGWNAADRAHGHNAYIQNLDTGTKTVEGNFFIAAFDVGVQEYGTGAATIAHIYNRNNIYADNGAPVGLEALQLVVGNGTNKHDIEVGGNWFYTSPQIGTGTIQVGWSWDVQNGDSNVHDNFVWGPAFQVWHWDTASVVRNQVYSGQTYFALYDKASPAQSLSKWTIDNNTYASNMSWVYAVTGLDWSGNPTNTYGTRTTDLATWKVRTGGQEAHSTSGASVPATYQIIPNKYEAGRANIVITNPGARLSSMVVDLSTTGLKDHDYFEIHDAQNFRGSAIATGTYLAASPTVTIPLTNLLRKRISGWSNTPPHTAPYFGTFVLMGGAALDGSWTYATSGTVPSDTVAPVVALNSVPQSVTGSITLTATASDSVGVTGVQYLLDGVNLGSKQTTAPYSITWDSTQTTNGQHTLTAVAFDAAGNQGTSAAVIVTVNNTAAATSPATSTATATFVKTDSTTQGTWKSVYGSEGEVIVNDSTTLPSYGQVTMLGGAAATWLASTTDLRAPQKSAATDRIASTWYQAASFTIDVNLTDSSTHQVALYLLDWDNNSRAERIDVTDASSGAVLDTRNASSFVNGLYLVWNIKGHVVFKITKTSVGSNGVVSAVFFGAGSVTTPASDTTPPAVSLTSPSNGATLSGTVSVSATAADNVAVAGVQFKVDGVNAAAEDTAAPYVLSLDTTKLTNASHTISATARDAAGNLSTASVTVTVTNVSVTQVATAKVPALYWTLDKTDVQYLYAIDEITATPLAMANVTFVPGHLGDAIAFNGSNTSLVGYTSAADLTTHLTVAAWIRTTNRSTAQTIVSKYDSSGAESGYLFHVNASGTLGLRLGAANVTTGSTDITDVMQVNDGLWHHVAVVITVGQYVSFYVDGVLTSQNPCKSTVASSGVPLDIGNDTFGYYGSPFTGTIDEVKIFRSALTAADVAALAQ